MSSNQYVIDPETHPADAAMAREHGNSPAPNGMSPEDSALWGMSTEDLKAKVLAEAGARDDFAKMQSELRYMEETSAVALQNPTTQNLGAAVTAGLRAEKADQVARQSAARIGIRDHEFNQALHQLSEFSPGQPSANQAAPPGAEHSADPSGGRPPATANGEPYVIKKSPDGSYDILIDTGEHFIGKSADEVIEKLTHSKRKTGIWGRDLNRQLQELRSGNGAQPSPQTSQAAPDPNQPTTTQPQFGPDADQFAKTLGFSGIGELASEWQGMQAKLQAANEFASKYEDEQLAERFVLENPDFPGTPEATAILEKIMDSSDLDWGKPENLTLAHQHAIRKGLYRPLTQEDIQAGTRGSSNASGRTVPPQPPPSGAPISDDIGNPWAMATDELRKRVLERGGLGKALLEMPAGSSLGS